MLVFVLATVGLLALVLLTTAVAILHARLGRLEREVLRLRGTLTEQARPAAATDSRPALDAAGRTLAGVPAAAAARPNHAVPTSPAAAATAPGPDRPTLEALIGGRWLTWIGVLTIFFGAAFFVSMDLRPSSLAGTFQVVVGLVVAAVFIVAGRWLAPKQERVLGLGLLGGGIGLLFLAAYAAYGFHRLVPAPAVYPFLAVVAVVGALLAHRQDSALIAGLTLAGALVTPLLLVTPLDAAAALFPYLAAVNLGAVLAGRRRGWAGLPMASFLGTVVLLANWASAHYTLAGRPGLAAVIVFVWLLHGVSPLIGQPAPGFWSFVRGTRILANGLLFGLAAWLLLSPDLVHLRGAALAGVAILYLLGSRLAARGGAGVRSPAGRPGLGPELTRITGVAIAAWAVPVQFDGTSVTLGWTLLAGALLAADLRGAGVTYRYLGLAVLVAALGASAFVDAITAAVDVRHLRPILNGGFLSGLALVALLAAFFVAYRRRARAAGAGGGAGLDRLATALLVVALSLLLWKITAEIAFWYAVREAASRRDLHRQMLLAISLTWAVYALALIGAGFAARLRALRRLGMTVVGLLVLKVFVVDWQVLQSGYRVASFLGVGGVLLVASVLYQRRRSPGRA